MNVDTCRHYNGTHFNTKCEAGIEYASVTPDPERQRGRALRLPCILHLSRQKADSRRDDFSEEQLREIALQGTCSMFLAPTQEEVDQSEKEREERFLKRMKQMESGFCPHCNQPMTKKQVGRCVYADPCGHRLYQGKA